LQKKKNMKQFLLPISVFFFLSFSSYAQEVQGTSPKYSFNISKEVKPPILSIVEGSIGFSDANNNKAIDALENCTIFFTVENNGIGDGIGLLTLVSASGSMQGISFEKNSQLDIIKVNEKKQIQVPVTSSMNTADGTIVFSVKVHEPNGFGTDAFQLEITTRAFVAPNIEVVDYTLTGSHSGNLIKKTPFDLQILVQNTQHGLAEQVKVQLALPAGVLCLSANELNQFTTLQPGEQKSIVYSMIVSDNFTGTTIPLTVNVSEKHNRYAKNKTITLQLNQTMSSDKLVVENKIIQENYNIVTGRLTSDVDRNIPNNNYTKTNRLALIIGNQDYTSRQRGLSSETNVPFALNDAKVFKEYCLKTLGVEEKNIYLLLDATAAEMSQKIELVSRLLSRLGKDAELIFYYAGHGFPDENTKEPYLIPVDVNAANLTSGIKLYDMYRTFANTGASRITVFLDACFSGGGRDAGLLASRSLMVKPKLETIGGNIVVFAATSEEQTALPYTQEQHGLFTYFLLRKIQETKGNVTYNELDEYLQRNVSIESLRVNRKDQKPNTIVSADIKNTWGKWLLK
jgi:hypothetical protein